MCDKPIPQQNLCAELADLYTSLPAHRKKDKRNDNGTEATGGGGLVSIWFAAAWEVLATHWTEIDVLRMDKFLLLTRRVFAAQLRWVRDAAWDEGRQGSVVDVLKAWPFESEGDVARVPLGLRLHALDIWVDEMERLGMLGEDEGDQAEGEEERQREGDAIAVRFAEKMRRQLIEPLTSCPVKPVRKSAGEQLEDDRLPWVRRKQADDGEAAEEDDEWGGIED
ncbi:hypothetical protein SODALDRAFT_334908 [Sodiomyces alkalinus F11]|uniref:Uncharacterized protein n=1 Tax=Sodiomyces alkalinus (strain CBS 110278 / VKM F-3762 / F11) TaxID=1314773 RepID=A0A3N2PQF6_SODAK|nr:hypothetical protein SODALDRAFT_334908 [Sodiomyces alkalinus F11]ROT36708.1 hypothetical protein SODALDRAFT_334908 [Sodiomyces alkalinus F11]